MPPKTNHLLRAFRHWLNKLVSTALNCAGGFFICKTHKHFPFTPYGFGEARTLAYIANLRGKYAKPEFCYHCGNGIIIKKKQESTTLYVNN